MECPFTVRKALLAELPVNTTKGCSAYRSVLEPIFTTPPDFENKRHRDTREKTEIAQLVPFGKHTNTKNVW
jgi:hypothetical protein